MKIYSTPVFFRQKTYIIAKSNAENWWIFSPLFLAKLGGSTKKDRTEGVSKNEFGIAWG